MSAIPFPLCRSLANTDALKLLVYLMLNKTALQFSRKKTYRSENKLNINCTTGTHFKSCWMKLMRVQCHCLLCDKTGLPCPNPTSGTETHRTFAQIRSSFCWPLLADCSKMKAAGVAVKWVQWSLRSRAIWTGFLNKQTNPTEMMCDMSPWYLLNYFMLGGGLVSKLS